MIKNTNGIQEVSGSIPLISTIEALKTIGFQGFLYNENHALDAWFKKAYGGE